MCPALVLYPGIVYLTYYGFLRLTSEEDQGSYFVCQGPLFQTLCGVTEIFFSKNAPLLLLWSYFYSSILSIVQKQLRMLTVLSTRGAHCAAFTNTGPLIELHSIPEASIFSLIPPSHSAARWDWIVLFSPIWKP